MKTFLYALRLSSLFVVTAAPVFSADNYKLPIGAAPLSKLPPQLHRPAPPAKPRAAAANPFIKRMQRVEANEKEEKAHATTLYPCQFSASQLELIVNAPLKGERDGKREAVALRFEGLGTVKVSSKVQNSLLNTIKEAINIKNLNGLTISSNTLIAVDPKITAEYLHICQANYKGGTAQEEERKTGKQCKGKLIEYILMKNGAPLRYTLRGESFEAKLIFSITTQ